MAGRGMVKPDYGGGGIVNLMASIAARFGHRTGHPQLRALPARSLRDHRTVVLIVLDGLGYDYLTTRGRGSFLLGHLRARMTSVFPSTTASCVTTFATGATPSQHGVTGWFTHLPELGTVSKILFAQPRYGGSTFSAAGIDFADLVYASPLFDHLDAASFTITPFSGDFNRVTRGRARPILYRDLDGFIRGIKAALRDRHREKFISAYWPDIDHLCHHHGIDHPRTAAHFRDLDRRLERLIAGARGSGALFLITADHGLIATPRSQCVELKRHPGLAQCLTLPLCGEPRLAYCYVRPDMTARFKRYVRTRLGHCCDLRTRAQLIGQGWYGPGRADPRLTGRIGDFILVMKPGWCIKDFLPNEDEVFLKANHGGVTPREMSVPLIVAGA
ncbi:MAG TPA: alkaline phosphatase family protein [Candidatus Edwardsbacteria bacterium]|nr:alkaline phosphatase family protein [Candidatus Edwardsbacteria bacterium]